MRRNTNTTTLVVTFIIGVVIGIAILAPYVTFQSGNQTTVQTRQNITTIEQPRSALAHILAVSTETDKGIIGTATVEIMPGHGRTLISANPFIEPDTQQSVAIARSVAENFTGVSLDNNDIIVSFDLPLGNVSAQVVGGPSAGAAITLAIIAATLNTYVRPEVAITGTILPDGTIGSVGGILEKAQAAGEAGMQIFIIPAGESNVTYYEKIENQTSRNGFRITRISYVPRTLSLNDYTKQWNMTTVEAETISEAARFAVFNLTLAEP